MYNIKQAAARAGVTVPVLRAWERRYGIVHPARTASGYRQFDDESIDRVRAMRRLVGEGWSPSAAAAAIIAAGLPGVAGAEAGASARSGERREEARASSAHPIGAWDVDALAERFVAAAASLQPDLVDGVLDDLFSRGSFERAATDLLFPALEELGNAWAAGRVSVAGEHMASSAVQRRLGLALDAAAHLPGEDGRVVVGLPPGGRHELGALAFAVAARRAGMAVTYLGADLPLDDWIAAADGASAAVIGVVTRRDRSAALEVARRLRAADPSLVVAVGGRAAPQADVSGLTRLPELLPDSVDALLGAIRQAREAAAP